MALAIPKSIFTEHGRLIGTPEYVIARLAGRRSSALSASEPRDLGACDIDGFSACANHWSAVALLADRPTPRMEPPAPRLACAATHRVVTWTVTICSL